MTIHVIGESPGGKPKLDWLLMILPELVTGAALLVESRRVSEIESTILAAIGGAEVGDNAEEPEAEDALFKCKACGAIVHESQRKQKCTKEEL